MPSTASGPEVGLQMPCGQHSSSLPSKGLLHYLMRPLWGRQLSFWMISGPIARIWLERDETGSSWKDFVERHGDYIKFNEFLFPWDEIEALPPPSKVSKVCIGYESQCILFLPGSFFTPGWLQVQRNGVHVGERAVMDSLWQ